MQSLKVKSREQDAMHKCRECNNECWIHTDLEEHESWDCWNCNQYVVTVLGDRLIRGHRATQEKDQLTMKMDRKIRSDHRLMIKTRAIEEQILELCKELTYEFGVYLEWSDVQKLSAGMPLNSLLDESKSTKSPIFCAHANEMPASCPCDDDCYCKEHSCKPKGRICPSCHKVHGKIQPKDCDMTWSRRGVWRQLGVYDG